MNIYPFGDPNSSIWVIVENPLPKDSDKGYLFSGALGWHFHKMWAEAGLPAPYITCLKPDTNKTYDDNTILSEFINDNCLSSMFTGQSQPKFIVPLGEDITVRFVPATQKRSKKKDSEAGASLDKWAGSLLSSPFIDYEHYLIPGYLPQDIISDWAYRDIYINIDLGHIRHEYEYWKLNAKLQPLPERQLITEPKYDELMPLLYEVLDYKKREYERAANDIETIRPAKKSPLFRGHPGYPYTNSFAISPKKGFSYSFWAYSPTDLVNIMSVTDAIYREVPLIGQNFFEFDAHLLEAMGFRPNLLKLQDTKLRHHQLWVELPHSLQFLCKQYTRQPYYKDEGKGWSPRQLKQYMRYNALDTTVTFEVFLGEESEFAERPYLI